MNDKSRGTCNTSNQMKFFNDKVNLCNYSDAYSFISETLIITGARADDAAKRTGERDKRIIYKNVALCTDCKF